MIPLRDVNPSRHTPWATYVLVAINVAVFVQQLNLQMTGGQQAMMAFINRVGLVPYLLLSPNSWGLTPLLPPMTVFSSMFVHAGLMHLLGNMLYLWIFADNVEDAMGSLRFLVFYLLCGVSAAATQVILLPDSTVPMVGASGAIAGVLGAYLILYPGAQVLTLIFLLFFVRLVYLPAVVLLGLWFLIQLLSAGSGGTAGVAWFAHIGGFVAGVLLISRFAVRDRRRMFAVTR